MKMRGKRFVLLLTTVGVLILVMGICSKDVLAAGPVITQSFASKEIVPGETWKIYVKASSPDANMKYFYATVDQAGGMSYPVSMTRIKNSEQKELSGFLYLYTSSAGKGMDFVTLKLTLQIGDDKKQFSEPAVFPLTFKPKASVDNPPAGMFPEKELGPIMIQLRPLGDDSGNSFF